MVQYIFYLGRDSDNKWSDFGGRVEPKDKNDYEATAAREFYEETLGSIYDYEHAKKLIKHKKCPKIVSKTGSGHPYYMYLIKITHNDEIRNKFTSTKNFYLILLQQLIKNMLKKMIFVGFH